MRRAAPRQHGEARTIATRTIATHTGATHRRHAHRRHAHGATRTGVTRTIVTRAIAIRTIVMRAIAIRAAAIRTIALHAGAALLLCLICAAARADDPVTKSNAIAVLGKPALPPDFPYFPYVNPNAPKGGAVPLAGRHVRQLQPLHPARHRAAGWWVPG